MKLYIKIRGSVKMCDVLYFWCFTLNREDDKPWYQRHYFGTIVSIILGTVGFIAGLTLGLYLVFVPIGILGEYITNVRGCEDLDFIRCVTVHMIYGIIMTVLYILNIVGTTVIISPIVGIGYLVLRSKSFRTICISISIASTIIALISVYDINVLGAIFFSDDWCNFGSYDNLLSCWSDGGLVVLIIGAIYVGIIIIVGICYGLYRCITDTKQIMSKQETDSLLPKS
jgi:hypothetical protein